jgi:hypothetical protein
MAELGSRDAPGRLEAVRAFVNTLDLEAGTDALASPGLLAEHLVAWQLLAPDRGLGATDLRMAIELRESLRTLLRAHNAQDVDTGPAVDVLNRVTSQAGLRPAMTYGQAVGYHVLRGGGVGALGATAPRAGATCNCAATGPRGRPSAPDAALPPTRQSPAAVSRRRPAAIPRLSRRASRRGG